ncbi:MAG: response regulator [Mangrovicoccus sp.]
MNILIVEDDPNLRKLWALVFEERDHRVWSVEMVSDAGRLLTQHCFDLVLLDLYLGRETGLEVAALAHQENPACRIVVVTGSSVFPNGELFEMAPGIASVLRKPVDIEHLVAVCDHAHAGAITLRSNSERSVERLGG